MDNDIFSRFSIYAVNAIEEENQTALKLERAGRKLIKLNIGDPARFFPTPGYIVDAYNEALRNRNTGYCEPEGIPELREAVADRYRRMYGTAADPDDVFVTHGVSEALVFMNSMFVNPGDMAIMLKPYYVVAYSGFRIFGGEPIFHEYKEEEGWDIDVEGLGKKVKKAKKEGKKVKYLMITNPSNPTGMVLSRKVLDKLVGIANDNDLVIISDEIYDEIVYNGAEFTSVSQVAKGIPHIILSGASKDLDATGFRIGFVIVPGEDRISIDIKKKVYDFCSIRLCANTPAQYAVAEGISNITEHKRHISHLVREIEDRANFASRLINESSYMHVVPPRGAYYVFPRIAPGLLSFNTDRDFVHALLEEEGILLTRGSGFGGDSHVRIVALPEKELLQAAIEKINRFCNRHSI
ncbi:MAG: aminotransferase class I/II-fold pyridoxal phosphate-dependent enzyme [Candidatus Micrarchaeaceae archaeon]